MNKVMKRVCQSLAAAVVFCQGLALAETVGVMADASTGALYPASVDARLTGLSIETNFDGTGSVSVPGLVDAVWSDTEAFKATTVRFDTNFPEGRLTWEDWGRGAHGTTYTSNNMLLEGGRLDKLAAGVAMFTISNGTVWVDSVNVHTNDGLVAASVDFHPELPEGQTIRFDSIRPAVLDNYGLHYGTATGEAASWTKLDNAPYFSAQVGIATSDGVTAFLALANNGVWKTSDGGASWTKLDNAPYFNAQVGIATSDGVTAFLAWGGNGVWKTSDGGASWTKLDNAPYFNNVSGGIATSDGVTAFLAWVGSGVWKTSPRFGTQATSPYTVIIQATEGDVLRVKDFEAAVSGENNVYWTLETAEDEWSVWGANEWPLQWRMVAQYTNGAWAVRGTNGVLQATAAQDAAEAVTLALETNALNRCDRSAYSPVYGYGAFRGGLPANWACTFYPASTNVFTNAPGVSGIHLLASQFSDGYHLATPDFHVELAATNPTACRVVWPEDFSTRALIHYRKED